MQYSKEREGNTSNLIGQVSAGSQTPWWSSFGSQPLTVEHHGGGGSAIGPKQGLEKGNATQFTLFAGDGKITGEGQKALEVFAAKSTSFELGFCQPVICANYPYMDQYYGVLSTYSLQIPGRIMLPLNMTTEDGPIYVNAKQYNGIMRRRQSRAKAVLVNKVTRGRKPYMHYSRHLHAMRRPRGSGGRFLNTKNLISEKSGAEAKEPSEARQPRSSGSQNSEVVHPDNLNLNSLKEASGNGSNVSGSEVTSVFARGEYINHIRGPSVRSLPGIPVPGEWVAAADNGCCNLKV